MLKYEIIEFQSYNKSVHTLWLLIRDAAPNLFNDLAKELNCKIARHKKALEGFDQIFVDFSLLLL